MSDNENTHNKEGAPGDEAITTPPKNAVRKEPTSSTEKDLEDDDKDILSLEEDKPVDPEVMAQAELINSSTPTTDLEIALKAALDRKTAHIERLTVEISKLRAFVSKRKQTYKRKRKAVSYTHLRAHET